MKFAIKALVTLTLLTYVGSKLDFGELSAHLIQVDFGTYLMGLAIMLLPILLTAARWQLLLRSQEIRLPLRYALGLGLSSQFFNAFLPGTTGGDAMRAYYVFAAHPTEKTRIITSVVFDRFLGIVAFCAISACILLTQNSLHESLTPVIKLAENVSAALLILTLLVTAYFLWPGHFSHQGIRRWVHLRSNKGVTGKLILFALSQRKRPMAFVLALSMTMLSCGFLFLSACFIADSMHLQMDYTTSALLMSAVAMTTAIPISMGGHGVREVTLISLLAPLGIVANGDLETPVVFSLLLVSMQLIWGLLGGIWYLFMLPRQTQSLQ